MTRLALRSLLLLALAVALPACDDDADIQTDMGAATDQATPMDQATPTDQGGRVPGTCGGSISCSSSTAFMDTCLTPGCTWNGSSCTGTPSVACSDADTTAACRLWSCTWSGNEVCSSGAAACGPNETCCPISEDAYDCAETCGGEAN